MKEARLVYYSIAAGRRDQDRQFAHSIATLRRHNAAIDVHLFVYNDPSDDLLASARRHDVTVHAMGDWRAYLRALSPHGDTLARLPTLHKPLSLAHLPPGTGDRVLFVDSDTHFFADVDRLFDRYREFDYYMREEPWTRRNGFIDPQHLDEDALGALYRREGLDPVIPFNTGVMLFNRGVWREIGRARPRFLEASWRLMLGAFQRPMRHGTNDPEFRARVLEAAAAAGPDEALPYPSGSLWLMDEVALWLTLGGITWLEQGIFDIADVMQNGEFRGTPPGIVAHYFSSCELEFMAWATNLAASEPDASAEADRPSASRVPDRLRTWAAENLLLDAPPWDIVRVLVGQGVDEGEAAAEVGRAQGSPYIRGAERLRNRLKKREWLLAVHRKLDRLRPGSGAVVRRHQPGRDEFFDVYYCGNRPVVIAGMMDDWPAMGRWGLDHFAARFGDLEVDIQFGHESPAESTTGGRSLRPMPMAEYVAMLRRAGATDDASLTADDGSRNKPALGELWQDVVPVSEYLDGRDPRAGSFRLAPAGSTTPFRHELTNVLLAQVVGRRRVLLAPSWDLPLVQNLHDVFSWMDRRQTPPSPGASFAERRVLECVVGPGEMLFLPVGWTYSAEDLDVSASLAFTNFLFDNDFHSFYTTRGGV